MTGKQFGLPNGFHSNGTSGSNGKAKQFSIEDAFEEETDEAIKVYGATTHPCSPDSRGSVTSHNGTCIGVTIDQTRNYKLVNDTSRDSDSLIQDGGGCYEPTDHALAASAVSCFRHPKVRENWRMVFAAVCLLVLGVLLIGFGTVTVAEPHKRLQGVVFLLTGFICFLPGIYHVVYIYLAAKGKRGYHFHNLPLFT